MATKPELAAHLLFEFSAFRDLSGDRSIGMDRGPIQWSSIDRYCHRYLIVGEEFERFARIIRALDEAYLGYKKEGV